VKRAACRRPLCPRHDHQRRSVGDAVFAADSEKEAAKEGDVVLNEIRPVLNELGVDFKRVTFSVSGWLDRAT
jgi:hypothetical protein